MTWNYRSTSSKFNARPYKVHSKRAWWGTCTVPTAFMLLHCCWQRWARNSKNVAPQKQKTICKTRAQYAKRNCAFELFKAHGTATINAKNASFHKKIFKHKERKRNFLK
jgi:hypothetical protein